MKTETYILRFTLDDEPNLTEMTAISFDESGGMEFNSVEGFEALDIYNKIRQKEGTNND